MNVRRFPGTPPELELGDPLTPYEQGYLHGPHGSHGLVEEHELPPHVQDELARIKRCNERRSVQNELLTLVLAFARSGRDAESATAEARKALEITRAAALELVPEYKP